MAGYSVEHHVQIIKLFYENRTSVRATFRALHSFYGRDDFLAESTIRRLLEKFESTGSVNNEPIWAGGVIGPYWSTANGQLLLT